GVAEIDHNQFATKIRIGAAPAGVIDEIKRTADRLAPSYQRLDERRRGGFGGPFRQRRAEGAEQDRDHGEPRRQQISAALWHRRAHVPPKPSRCLARMPRGSAGGGGASCCIISHPTSSW